MLVLEEKYVYIFHDVHKIWIQKAFVLLERTFFTFRTKKGTSKLSFDEMRSMKVIAENIKPVNKKYI